MVIFVANIMGIRCNSGELNTYKSVTGNEGFEKALE